MDVVANETIEFADVIDGTRLRPFHIGVALLCGMAVLLDGFDVLVISYVAPALVQSLGISRAMLGPVFSAALIGTTVGALLFSPLADVRGRKPVLIACLLLFGLCTLGTATAHSVGELLAWRFVGGLGLGGCAPIAVALLSELCPARSRATLLILMYCGYSVGAAGGGLLAAWLLGIAGWRSVFVVGGVLPLILAAVMLARLPESLSCLLRRGRQADAMRLLHRLGASHVGAIALPEQQRGLPLRLLFTDGRAPRTVLLWLMFFANILALYFMTSWLPTLVNAAGVGVRTSVVISTTVQIGSIAGTILLAIVIARFRVFAVLSAGFLLGAGALLVLSHIAAAPAPLAVAAFLAGFFVIGTQTAANAASALAYPPAMRSTGVGWALGIGRIGSFVGPAIGGALIGLEWRMSSLFLLAAVPAALAGILAAVIAGLLARDARPA
ncbi:MAG: MFS transporter [Acetobacteraceae bacterium]|nr:MFS transporter [Acetobacteraceae bacterium]